VDVKNEEVRGGEEINLVTYSLFTPPLPPTFFYQTDRQRERERGASIKAIKSHLNNV
jgi:putative NADPH-quinone reductase